MYIDELEGHDQKKKKKERNQISNFTKTRPSARPTLSVMRSRVQNDDSTSDKTPYRQDAACLQEDAGRPGRRPGTLSNYCRQKDLSNPAR